LTHKSSLNDEINAKLEASKEQTNDLKQDNNVEKENQEILNLQRELSEKEYYYTDLINSLKEQLIEIANLKDEETRKETDYLQKISELENNTEILKKENIDLHSRNTNYETSFIHVFERKEILEKEVIEKEVINKQFDEQLKELTKKYEEGNYFMKIERNQHLVEIEQIELENKILSEEIIKKDLLIDDKDKEITNISAELAIKFNDLKEQTNKIKNDKEM